MLRIALVIDDYNELIYLQTLLKKLGFDVEGLQNTKKYVDLSLGFNPYVLITSAKGKKVNGLALAKSLNKPRGLPKVIVLQTAISPVTTEEKNNCNIDLVIDSPINVFKFISALSVVANLDEAQLIEKYNKIKSLISDNSTSIENADFEIDDNGQPIRSRNQLKNDLHSIGVNSDLYENNESKSPRFPINTNTSKSDLDLTIQSLDLNATIDPDEPHNVNANLSERNQLLNELISQSLDDNKGARTSRFDSWLKNMEPLINKNFDRERIISFNKLIRSAAKPDDILEVEDERKKFVKAMFKKI